MKIEKVIEHFGGISATARALLVSYQAVQQWRDKGEIPLGRQYQIESVTHGHFKAKPAPAKKRKKGKRAAG